MSESIWAYFAGIVDGEGHLTLFRHYKPKSKVGISKRGYELEPHMKITNMNKRMLTEISNKVGSGTMNTLIDKRRKDGIEGRHTYDLRFYPNQQRIILPKIIPHLIQKKEMATVLLEFLDFRQKSMPREEKEKGYLSFEEKFWSAYFNAKPWLIVGYSKRKKNTSPELLAIMQKSFTPEEIANRKSNKGY
jgi:hypothetical protein